MPVQHAFITVKGRQLPVKIYRERRNGVRASIREKAAILRLPLRMDKKEEQDRINWFIDWVRKEFDRNKRLANGYFGRIYKDGDELIVGERRYLIRIQLADRKTSSGKISNGVILLNLSSNNQSAQQQQVIKKLLSRLIAQDFHPYILRRVLELNELYFQQPVNGVALKYTNTRWGSCSSEGNINLSTRLLFTPPAVVDYVIIHELAHRIEMNHSPKFWNLVERAMPNYPEMEKWLKDHGDKCDF